MGTRLLTGLVVIFGLFQWMAHQLGSDRGQAGIAVGALVVMGTVGFQRWFFDHTFAQAARSVGLGWPAPRGLSAAAAVALVLLLVVPAFAYNAHTTIAFHPGWAWLLPGLFAQAGVAEEVLFRGYLFGNLRRRHTFWRAAVLSMVPFVAVHLLMFGTLPWSIALASVGLAVAMSFPLARLFELGGGTIWAPALLHFAAQATPKVVQTAESASSTFALAWIAACAVTPYLVFLLPPRSVTTAAR